MNNAIYKTGQIIKIGYYGGFHCRTLMKTTAEIISCNNNFVRIKVFLPSGGFRNMFGYSHELKELELNYSK